MDADKITSNQVKTMSKFDQHEIFKSGVEAIMQMLLNNISYRYYKYGLFLGVSDRYLTCHYKCPTDMITHAINSFNGCLLYTSPSPRDATLPRMPSSA